MDLIAGIIDHILSLPGWVVLGLVFLFPALEASAFVGFVFPGEIAVVLGGVAASRGSVPLWPVVVAAVAGAIVGDSVGYVIGRRWGTHLLHGTIGRLPIIRTNLDTHLKSARAFVRRRRGAAVFFGRFTAALRVLVPGLVGMSDVHYPTFLAFNVLGGTLLGTSFVLLGYLAGAGYHRAEHIASRFGLLLLAAIVLGLIASRLLRKLRTHSQGHRAALEPLAATRPIAWLRRRFPRPLAWAGRRLDPSSPTGFWLTFAMATCALAAWAFGGITEDVVAREQIAMRDPHATAWMVAHRTPWVTGFMQVVTWLGSTAIIIPLALIVGVLLLLRARKWQPLALFALGVAGAVLLYNMGKTLVGRPRPPSAIWIGHFSGFAFPSGHATQSVAFYGLLAFVLARGRSPQVRAILWGSAAAIVLVIGVSRVYLGAHWMSDVLGGYALGAAWSALLVVLALVASSWRRGGATEADSGAEPDEPGATTTTAERSIALDDSPEEDRLLKSA